jgi:hypothetical protein
MIFSISIEMASFKNSKCRGTMYMVEMILFQYCCRSVGSDEDYKEEEDEEERKKKSKPIN